jgi:hypothetical protein
MNQNLEAQMFQAGASQRMAELAELEKSAGWAGKAIKAVTSPSGPVRTAINGAIPSISSGLGRPMGAVVRKSPLKTLAGGAAVLGGTAVGSNIIGQRQGANKVIGEVNANMAGIRQGLMDYSAKQGFGENLADLIKYLFQGKSFAINKMNDINRYISSGKYLTPGGNKFLAGLNNPTVANVAKIN